MPFVKRQRTYYKDGVEVPSSSITDFGSYKYFKNVVTTKYWKEITTGSKELEYACYSNNGSYVYATKDLKIVKQSDIYLRKVTASNNLTEDATRFCRNITIDSLEYNFAAITGGSYWVVFSRSYADDLYIDTTVTETVEGTPEDYTYTTEEVTPVEVTADDEYDFTEFVPSADFDYYEDNNSLYNITKRHRTYYKYSTEPNASIVGSLTIDGGVVSGFSASNYLQIPNTFSPTTNAWEMVFKVKTGTVGGWQYFIGANTNYIINVGLNNDNKMLVNIGSGSWTVMTGTTTLQADTEYTFKVVYDGANYKGYVDDNLEFTVASSIVPNTALRLGNDVTVTSEYWRGSIDLTQSYININGTRWWHGTKAVESAKDDYDYYTDRNVSYNIMLKR